MGKRVISYAIEPAPRLKRDYGKPIKYNVILCITTMPCFGLFGVFVDKYFVTSAGNLMHRYSPDGELPFETADHEQAKHFLEYCKRELNHK